jgi:hypothetical protein
MITSSISVLNRSALLFMSLMLTGSANAQQQATPISETQVLQDTEAKQHRSEQTLLVHACKLTLNVFSCSRTSSQLESSANEITKSEQGRVSGNVANALGANNHRGFLCPFLCPQALKSAHNPSHSVRLIARDSAQ